MKTVMLVFATSFLLTAIPGVAPQNAGAGRNSLKGWLSDEQCARGRAASGTFTGTSPYCAKQCVAKGAKIVLILPDEKEILSIENQDEAKDNIGDYVEVTGNIESTSKTKEGAKTIHIDALKMITKGKTMCGIPKKN